jgi:hypothetical protein
MINRSDAPAMAAVLCARNRGRIREAPIVFRDWRHGKSKLGRGVIVKAG